jgi:hypothetical protein
MFFNVQAAVQQYEQNTRAATAGAGLGLPTP